MPDSSFIAHLEALRRTLIKCLAAVGLACVPAYFCVPAVIEGLVKWSFPAGSSDKLYFFAPMEVFLVELKMALTLGFLAAVPYCLWQAWGFLLPALWPAERRILRRFLALACVLFYAGLAFSLWAVLPLAMGFSLSFASAALAPALRLSDFLDLAQMLAVAFGVMFQFPLAVCLAVRFGLTTRRTLQSARPYVVVGILIIAAILTPPDIVSQLLLAVPTWLLFEVGLLLARDKPKPPTEPAETADETLAFYDKESAR
ncbi:Sec-independent protein translocase protein TatC [Alphaproteobacteria bacterium]|nr:Sec-independent protein translocase protein TatC [Alphaproteobacteria bacterium]